MTNELVRQLIEKMWKEETTPTNTEYADFVASVNKNDSWGCLLLGLCGEAGEVADAYKKSLYKNTPVDEGKLKEELSDVLWCVTALATKLNITVKDLEVINRAKLEKRWYK